MLHMLTVIPPDWRMVFIGSEKSVISVGRSFAVKHQQVVGKLDLMVLPEPWEIDSKEKVYRLMTDIRFYDEFLPGVEWILKYEYDSILCANSEQSLNDWLHWSWAGAPRYTLPTILKPFVVALANSLNVGPQRIGLQETVGFHYARCLRFATYCTSRSGTTIPNPRTSGLARGYGS